MICSPAHINVGRGVVPTPLEPLRYNRLDLSVGRAAPHGSIP
jgi:hypothetical protein